MPMEIKTIEVSGFAPAITGMRNPKDSWDRSDSFLCVNNNDCDNCPLVDSVNCNSAYYVIGSADMKLATDLIRAGSEHRKFLRMITVWFDADMPRYFWQEFDTYHHNTKNSCSTMHKLLNRKTSITKDDFVYCEEDVDIVELVIDRLEVLRYNYNNPNYSQEERERFVLRAKRLLPEGFLQLRTVCTNYEELRTIYHQRKHHRLKEEWVDNFCRWVEESLPYSNEFICS